MPYIDSTPSLSPFKIREGDLQNGFKNLLLKHGWTKALEFKKAACSTQFVTETNRASNQVDGFTVAKHIILRNARSDLFGIAVVADWKETTGDNKNFPFYNISTSSDAEKTAFINYLEGTFAKRKNETTLYYYMLDKLPNAEDGTTILTYWGLRGENDKRIQMALDTEVTQVDFKSPTDVNSVYIKAADPLVMQSPIVESSLRAPFLEKLDYPYVDTNWWADSEVSFKGYLDSKNMFLILQADNTPMWDNNVVPTVPLYFGDIVPMDEGDPAVALFAGTVPKGSDSTTVAKFNFDDITIEGGKRIMPVLKKYPSNPSNGIDSVIINRTKLGSRYQSYFLSWNTPSHDMPPLRASSSGERKYPRAWDNKGYQFNPSRYSGKVQTSLVYLVHPEEGVRGHLKKTVGLNAVNFNSSELRIRQDNCPETMYDVYQCTPVSAVSPLTKRPATPFRPMGIGIFKEVLNMDNSFVPNSTDTKSPSDVENLTATNPQSSTVHLSWSPPNDQDLAGFNISVDGKLFATGVTVEVSDYVIKGIDTGEHTFEVVVVDLAGNSSSGTSVTLSVS
ncbi:hypothetical protein [Bacillus haynesii]|uniref:hypothetical protein n=1 Tax=Bacillus haynesii TaxID=1925021 RepID=UPI0022806F64|nr:hypothetical protein [Bacillus haynesii]MCY8291519.1 fibronectin type III domain-containing protein [Bacillus haynesii]